MADQGAEGLLSPLLRRQRLRAVKPYLNGRILDVGCGSGALAGLIEPASYLGVEVDEASLQMANECFPRHSFQRELPAVTEKFDTVVALAVIEHVSDPAGFLIRLAQYLKTAPRGKLVITTPHPSVGWIHDLGVSIGLFSKHANEEHDELLDEGRIRAAADASRLEIKAYSRFLLGANQLAIFTR